MSYVANIKLERVENSVDPQKRRTVTEGLNITVRSSTLEGLKSKLAKHVDLLDEEDL